MRLFKDSYKKAKNLKLHLGCGKHIMPGYVNCDIQKFPGVDLVFDCVDLSRFKDKSTKMIYSQAFFEHLYLYQQGPFLMNCKRILKDNGYLVILGIPDFEKICQLYLSQPNGSFPFNNYSNLYWAYRLTHGDFELNKKPCIPQLHKALFDKSSLIKLLKNYGLKSSMVFNYTYFGEDQDFAIGIIATSGRSFGSLKAKRVLSEFGYCFNNFKELCVS